MKSTISLNGLTALGLVKSIQRGTFTTGADALSATATISAVVRKNTILRCLGVSQGGLNNRQPCEGAGRLSFSNDTTLLVSRNGPTSGQLTTLTASYEVIQYHPGVLRSVQRGTVVGATTATVSAVVEALSILDLLAWDSTSTLQNSQDTGLNPYIRLASPTGVACAIGYTTQSATVTAGFQLTEYMQ